MTEDGYLSSAWDGDHSDFQNSAGHGRPQLRTFESADTSSSSSRIDSTSPIPVRTSVDSAGRASTSRWQESPTTHMTTLERRDNASTIHSEPIALVEPTFDESVLRALCDLDVSQLVRYVNGHAKLMRYLSVECRCFLTE